MLVVRGEARRGVRWSGYRSGNIGSVTVLVVYLCLLFATSPVDSVSVVGPREGFWCK